MPRPLSQQYFLAQNAVSPIGGAHASPVPRYTAEPVSTTALSTPEPLEALAANLLIACSAHRLATETRREFNTLKLVELARDTSLARHCPNHDFNGADWAKERDSDPDNMSLYVYDGAPTPLTLLRIREGFASENEPCPRKFAIDLVPELVETWKRLGSAFGLARWARGHAVPLTSFGPYFRGGKPTLAAFNISEGLSRASMTGENLRALAQEVLKLGSDFKFRPWCSEHGMKDRARYFARGELSNLALRRLEKMKFEWPSTPLGNKYRRRMEQLAETYRAAKRSSGPQDGSSKTSLKRAASARSSNEPAKRPSPDTSVPVTQGTGGGHVQSGVALWLPPGLPSVQLHRPWERQDFHRPWES